MAPVGMIVAAAVATIILIPGLEVKAADARRIVVEIRGFQFIPEAPVVDSGDVVIWKSMDFVPHTVTSNDDSWESDLIAAGSEWETVISVDMIQDYHYSYHSSMIGRLTIGAL
jgi:plastocyanin